jgi:uridylate kinase
MNIVKFGGSIVNPNGKYDNTVIREFITLVRNSKEKFVFVVGGGKICRKMQDACQPFLEEALEREHIDLARDSIGIAATKINARYVLRRFQEAFGKSVYPEIILDPTQAVNTRFKIFIAAGWKPGMSTDADMMLLAQTFGGERVFKISNFAYVKNVRPTDLVNLSEEEQKSRLATAEDIKSMKWSQLRDLVGTEWISGLNTPFDPAAVKVGMKLRKQVTLYIGQKEEFMRFLKVGSFHGTVVSG